MDKETLPRSVWLLLGLFVMLGISTVLNAFVFGPAGLPESYYIVTNITAMSLVVVYLGVWYDDDRQQYWEHARERIVADIVFVLGGTAVGASIALAVLLDTGLPRLAIDLGAMAAGFMLGWGLFWWRNPDLYRLESGS